MRAAELEFGDARRTLDDIKLAQVAEKGWGAVREATKGLLEKLGRATPKGTATIERELNQAEDANTVIQDAALSDRFGRLMKDLHIECFGEGICSVKMIDRDLRKVREYIQLAKKL